MHQLRPNEDRQKITATVCPYKGTISIVLPHFFVFFSDATLTSGDASVKVLILLRNRKISNQDRALSIQVIK